MNQGKVERIEGQQFTDVRVLGGGKVYEGLEFSRTRFVRCKFAQFDGPPRELVARNVRAVDCRADRCHAQNAYFDEVVVENLQTSPMMHLYGCVFRHVVLRGRIGPMMAVGPNTTLPKPERTARAAAVVEAYQDIDWALDISEASFVDADFYYVPGHLVRRDPQNQFLLRRESFADMDVSTLPTVAKFAVMRFESTPFDSIVAVAPKGSKEFERDLDALEYLRSRGLAE